MADAGEFGVGNAAHGGRTATFILMGYLNTPLYRILSACDIAYPRFGTFLAAFLARPLLLFCLGAAEAAAAAWTYQNYTLGGSRRPAGSRGRLSRLDRAGHLITKGRL